MRKRKVQWDGAEELSGEKMRAWIAGNGPDRNAPMLRGGPYAGQAAWWPPHLGLRLVRLRPPSKRANFDPETLLNLPTLRTDVPVVVYEFVKPEMRAYSGLSHRYYRYVGTEEPGEP